MNNALLQQLAQAGLIQPTDAHKLQRQAHKRLRQACQFDPNAGLTPPPQPQPKPPGRAGSGRAHGRGGSRASTLTKREAHQLLEAAGFVHVRTNAHERWKHTDGRVASIPTGSSGKVLSKAITMSLKQVGIDIRS